MIKCTRPGVKPASDPATQLLFAVTLQAVEDVTNVRAEPMDRMTALDYLNDERIQDLHETLGINIRRQWERGRRGQ